MVKLPALVLAAGLSSRMGDFKPLMELGGKKLIDRVIGALLTSHAISDVMVVTGHRHEQVEAVLQNAPGVRTVFNERFAAGEMLSSLHQGIEAILRTTAAGTPIAGFVLAFADQPAVQSATIKALVERFFSAPPVPLVLPTHRGQRGHPIIISAALLPEIMALGGTETLRTVVHRHLAQAALVEVNDASVLEDLDTPEDFARASALHS